MNKFLLWGSVFLTGTWLLKKANLYKKIDFKITGVRATGFFPYISASITFNVINTTNTTAKLTSIKGKVFLNNKYLGDAYNYKTLNVAGSSITPYSIDINLDSLNVITTIVDGITKKSGLFTFDGIAVINGFSIPFTYDFNLLKNG